MAVEQVASEKTPDRHELSDKIRMLIHIFKLFESEGERESSIC